jgi:hypothetical protein
MWTGDEKEIQKLFDQWRGSNGQVWEYVCGHGTLLVRFFRPNSRLSLYLQCKDCRRLEFESFWENSDLLLHKRQQKNVEDPKFEIRDGDRFFVACFAVYLKESEKPFHIDWPPESLKISDKYIIE